MRENGLPSGYMIDGQSIAFGDIGRQFNTSKYGEILRNNVRFSTFKPEATSHVQWEKLLGADVNNLNHLQLSLGLTKSFLRHCANPDSTWQGKVPHKAKFSPKEQSLLLLTAKVHDWGEAVISDIPLPMKTKADEEKEMLALRGIVHDILGKETNADFCEKMSDEVEGVLTNTSSKLGKAFNAIEHVGYVRTGLRAWHESKKTGGELRTHLEHMASDVVLNSTPKLLAYAKVYPPVDLYVAYHTDTINQICEVSGMPLQRGVLYERKMRTAEIS